jgi:hypothetical protein
MESSTFQKAKSSQSLAAMIRARSAHNEVMKNVISSFGVSSSPTPARSAQSQSISPISPSAKSPPVVSAPPASFLKPAARSAPTRPPPHSPTRLATSPVPVSTSAPISARSPVSASASASVAKYVPKVATFQGAAKCCRCTKAVYKMEEVVAIGEVWHDKCFTCGGKNEDGCSKMLKLDGYVDHGGQPYCNACYSKLFRPKGFGYGNTLNTDYGPDPRAAPKKTW